MAEDSPVKPKRPDLDAVLLEALARDDVPKIYANGFGVGLSNADVFVVFQKFGPKPVAVLNLSYTLAKTLAQRLGQVVSEFERAVGDQNILTTDRIDEAFRKAKASRSQEAPESEPEEDADPDANVH